jgi:site-specific DNA-methyltransferase (adenine-specific)
MASRKELTTRSPKNKTLSLTDTEISYYDSLLPQISTNNAALELSSITDKILNGDLFSILSRLPEAFADLVIVDPPYNLDKDFHGNCFKARSSEAYQTYIESWLPAVLRCAKSDASIYVCCDWKSSCAIFSVLERHCTVRNRITWQREKGRGALHNWKNCSEDIWYATKGEDFFFDVQAVMQRKRVVAPYRENGIPKDWIESEDGKFRLTHPSNFWDDITVPYWSMSENTEHPTQKPEKLIAKLILASSRTEALIFDPFAGSGTTAVTAKKLNRHYVCVEQNRTYCLWAHKRLENATTDKIIQGYSNGAFLERNSKG